MVMMVVVAMMMVVVARMMMTMMMVVYQWQKWRWWSHINMTNPLNLSGGEGRDTLLDAFPTKSFFHVLTT